MIAIQTFCQPGHLSIIIDIHIRTKIYIPTHVVSTRMTTLSSNGKYLLWVLSVCPAVSSSMILSTIIDDCVAYEDQWIILLEVDCGTRRMRTLTDGAITKKII